MFLWRVSEKNGRRFDPRYQFGNVIFVRVYFTGPKTFQMHIEAKMKTNKFIRQEALEASESKLKQKTRKKLAYGFNLQIWTKLR